MKLLSALFCLGFAVMSANAADVEQRRAEEVGKTYKVLKTRLNSVYRDVTVTKVTDAGISIMHSEGTARLGYERLTPEQRETFGITREGAEAVYAKEKKAKAAYEAHLAARKKAWLEEQEKAQEERLTRQEFARLEAERSASLRALEQPEVTGTTSIVSTLEVPTFPIIRGPGNEVLRPIQITPRTQRRTSGNTTTIYTGSYGGTYGYPVRYNSGCYPSSGYPSRYGTYRPSYHRGSYGAINYNGGKWNIGIRW